MHQILCFQLHWLIACASVSVCSTFGNNAFLFAFMDGPHHKTENINRDFFKKAARVTVLKCIDWKVQSSKGFWRNFSTVSVANELCCVFILTEIYFDAILPIVHKTFMKATVSMGHFSSTFSKAFALNSGPGKKRGVSNWNDMLYHKTFHFWNRNDLFPSAFWKL